MAEEKTAQKVFSLGDIKFNEENKLMAILACIPVVGLILLFVEKDDDFVRYMGAQYTIVGAIQLVSSVIYLLIPFVSLAVFVLVIMGMVKVSKGERFDIPMVSEWALKLMSKL